MNRLSGIMPNKSSILPETKRPLCASLCCDRWSQKVFCRLYHLRLARRSVAVLFEEAPMTVTWEQLAFLLNLSTPSFSGLRPRDDQVYNLQVRDSKPKLTSPQQLQTHTCGFMFRTRQQLCLPLHPRIRLSLLGF